jgi:hypothetical protein
MFLVCAEKNYFNQERMTMKKSVCASAVFALLIGSAAFAGVSGGGKVALGVSGGGVGQ